MTIIFMKNNVLFILLKVTQETMNGYKCKKDIKSKTLVKQYCMVQAMEL